MTRTADPDNVSHTVNIRLTSAEVELLEALRRSLLSTRAGRKPTRSDALRHALYLASKPAER